MGYVRKKRRLTFRKKRLLDTSVDIDYKQPDTLKRFITDRGKIIPRRVSGASASQQRVITKAVKRARYLALVPFSVAHRQEKDLAVEVALQFASTSSRMSRHQSAPFQQQASAPADVATSAPAPEGNSEE